jgi:NADPH-dependent 2,4-dienoyl-CoA reductase/sulfur reductase-like enzyme
VPADLGEAADSRVSPHGIPLLFGYASRTNRSMDLISAHPFWPLNSGLIRSYPRLQSDLQCEVLVLGAGITGALCAYHLAKAGMDVAVLDKRDVASGSTSASTAMLQYEIDTPLTGLIGSMGNYP